MTTPPLSQSLGFWTPKECAEVSTQSGPLYQSSETFLRAFRGAGFKTTGPAGKKLVRAEDFRNFLDGKSAQ